MRENEMESLELFKKNTNVNLYAGGSTALAKSCKNCTLKLEINKVSAKKSVRTYMSFRRRNRVRKILTQEKLVRKRWNRF